MEEIHVAIAAEKITEWMGVPITNTLIMSWVVVLVLVLLSLKLQKNLSLVPGKLQSVAEVLFFELRKFVEETLESKALAARFTPFLLALFLFILIGNWMEFIP